jgi:hypothetical protein
MKKKFIIDNIFSTKESDGIQEADIKITIEQNAMLADL